MQEQDSLIKAIPYQKTMEIVYATVYFPSNAVYNPSYTIYLGADGIPDMALSYPVHNKNSIMPDLMMLFERTSLDALVGLKVSARFEEQHFQSGAVKDKIRYLSFGGKSISFDDYTDLGEKK